MAPFLAGSEFISNNQFLEIHETQSKFLWKIVYSGLRFVSFKFLLSCSRLTQKPRFGKLLITDTAHYFHVFL